jgi:AraC-like DNA-binding protein
MDTAFISRVTVLLAHAQRLNGWNHDRLAAPHWRLYWNGKPGASVMLNGQSTPIDPGNLIIIPPETPFSSRLIRPVAHLYFHFMVEPMGKAEPAVLAFPVSQEQRASCERIMDGFLSGKPSGVLQEHDCMALIHQTLARVPEAWLKPAGWDARVQNAIRSMEKALADDWRNDSLARAAHMNTNAFIRLFSQQTGMGPQAYLNVKRIERACGLLHSPSVSIKEIAEATGFCDRYHFTRVFRKLRGLPPAEFRKRVCMR